MLLAVYVDNVISIFTHQRHDASYDEVAVIAFHIMKHDDDVLRELHHEVAVVTGGPSIVAREVVMICYFLSPLSERTATIHARVRFIMQVLLSRLPHEFILLSSQVLACETQHREEKAHSDTLLLGVAEEHLVLVASGRYETVSPDGMVAKGSNLVLLCHDSRLLSAGSVDCPTEGLQICIYDARVHAHVLGGLPLEYTLVAPFVEGLRQPTISLESWTSVLVLYHPAAILV